MVSAFSNTKVTNGPTGIRRFFFSAITWVRKDSRSRSYARRSAMSSRVSFGMGADPPRRSGAGVPSDGPASVPDRRRGDVLAELRSGKAFEALGEATGVALLGPGEGLEPLGDLFEVLVTGGLGEPGVHLGVLVGLAGDGGLEVVGRGPDGLTGHGVARGGEEVEVAEGVTRLTLR